MNGRLEHELEINNRIENMISGIPESQLINDFYLSIKTSKTPTTCYDYIKVIRRFSMFLDSKSLLEATEEDVQKYLEENNYKTNKRGEVRRVSAQYIRQICSSLTQFYNYLERKRIITENPLRYIERPSRKDVVERPKVTFDDLDCIIDAAKEQNKSFKWRRKDLAILYLLMITGMRETALTEINVSDIDWENETLTVIDKRDKEQVYYLNYKLKRALNYWLQSRKELLEEAGIADMDALFFSRNFQRISAQEVYRTVRRCSYKGIGIRLTPHQLRATFITLYYEKTKDIEATRRAVGHANVDTTALYIKKNNKARKDAMDFMSAGII